MAHNPTRGPAGVVQQTFNVQPASTKQMRNALVAKPTEVAEALTSMGPQRRCDRGDVVVMPLQGNAYCRDDPTAGFGMGQEGDPSYTLKGDNDASVVVTERVRPIQEACATRGKQGGVGVGAEGAPSYTLTTRHDAGAFVEDDPDEAVPSMSDYSSVVRRLTPREYERLQGMEDDFTRVDWKGKQAPDGRRYKAVGNSMAVPVMRWLGRRLLMVEEILEELGS